MQGVILTLLSACASPTTDLGFRQRAVGRCIMAALTTSEKGTSVRGLGEIALRVNNLDAVQKFYEEVMGLPLMTRFPDAAFFKIADGYGGHSQVLALFDRSESPGYRGADAKTSTIDHIAFEIPLADFEGEKRRLETLGLLVETAEHAWCIGARFM
jgi:catechol-2,3-dioxygenase